MSHVAAWIVVSTLFILTLSQPCFAELGPGPDDPIPPLQSSLLRGAQYSIGLKKFVNSFTSYQFPNPFPPEQDPLSRLEFPIDQWFIGISATHTTRYWALTADGWLNLTRNSNKDMQDSDWDDEFDPGQKTIFSESKCRLNKGVLCDVGLIINSMYENIPVKPVLGYRYQSFFFTTHDGEQFQLGGDPVELYGDGIDFTQIFHHVYFGGYFCKVWDLRNFGQDLPYLPVCKVTIKADYAKITGRNEDAHLLRIGNRITTEKTSGHCWRVAAAADVYRKGEFSAKLEGDFKRVITYGNHELTNDLFSIRFSFDGAKVWSDQASIAAVGTWAF